MSFPYSLAQLSMKRIPTHTTLSLFTQSGPIKALEHTNRASVTAKGSSGFTDLHGYLKKKSRHDRWQKRWFEANDHYLTYYKSPQSEKLLACIDLYQTGGIKLATEDNDCTGEEASEFSLELGERFYIIKAGRGGGGWGGGGSEVGAERGRRGAYSLSS